MIKKRKDGDESDSLKMEEQGNGKNETPDANGVEPGAESNGAQKGVDDKKAGNTPAGDESGENGKNEEPKGAQGEKQPTEADVLKFYLKQTLENAKKTKEENDSLKAQVEKLDSQLKKCNEKFDSVVSEYENYRRRTTSEKANLGAEATAKVVMAMLPALDNLERAMPFSDSNPESFKKGVAMTLRQLQEAIASLGVEEIEAKDAVFDPNLHNAVMHVEDDSLGESVITDVFQKGYRLGDKVIRHSAVKVAN